MQSIFTKFSHTATAQKLRVIFWILFIALYNFYVVHRSVCISPLHPICFLTFFHYRVSFDFAVHFLTTEYY